MKWAPDQICYFVCLFTLILTFVFTHVYAIIFYDLKQFLDVRTVVTNLNLDLYFSESSGPDPQYSKEEVVAKVRQGRQCHDKTCRRAYRPPFTSVLLANVQSLENKLDDVIFILVEQAIEVPTVCHPPVQSLGILDTIPAGPPPSRGKSI